MVGSSTPPSQLKDATTSASRITAGVLGDGRRSSPRTVSITSPRSMGIGSGSGGLERKD